MNKLQTNVNDIKSVAKILKKELASMNFELSHSSALNLASRSLGFKNYQTYIGLEENELSIDEVLEEFFEKVKERKSNYPRIHETFFVKFKSMQNYDIYIYGEFLENENIYSLLFELKDSYTGRTFFHPKDNTFFIFDEPSMLPYQYQMNENNVFYYFDMINQLKEKSWTTNEVIDDLMKLIEAIEYDREKLISITNKYSNQELEQLYKKDKND